MTTQEEKTKRFIAEIVERRRRRVGGPTQNEVQQWIKRAPRTVWSICVEMAALWREGVLDLTSIDSAELINAESSQSWHISVAGYRATLTPLGRSSIKRDIIERDGVQRCWGCGKSSGVIKDYIVRDTKTGDDVIEFMHEECFVALPLVQ